MLSTIAREKACMADRKSVVQVKFRLRKEVLRQLERAAKAGDRSINEEIERRLEQSIRQEEQQELLEKAAKKALDLFSQERGFPYVGLQTPPATEAPPAKSTDESASAITVGRLGARGLRRDEAKAAPTPAGTGQRDKAS
jgi:hypothetical protein